MDGKARRTYRFLEFVGDSLAVLVRLPMILRARRRRRVSKALEEKLMLTVTAVNGCRYCAWFHEREAARCRIPGAEVASLLSGAIDRPVGSDEASALLFAQHYAQSNRRPAPEAVARLREAYGDAVAGEILLITRIISLGNLAGNTYRSFLDRVRGRGNRDVGLVDGLLVFLATAPLFGSIGWMMARAPAPRR